MKRLLVIILIMLSCSVISAFAEVSEKDAEINSLYAANKLDDAFNLLITVPQDERSAQQWLIMGNIMLDYGRTEDAEDMFNSALKVQPSFYKAHYNLGNMHLNNNQPYLAIENYKLAIKYKKDFAPAYYNMGCAYLKVNELKKAKNAFRDATFFNPNVAEYHYNLAYVYKQLGKEKDAKTYLGYYNKLRPGY